MVLSANIGSVVEYVRDSIYNIPSYVDSGNNIQNFIDLSRIEVQNYTGESIDTTNITEKYIPLLKNMGCAYVLSKMIGARVDFDVTLGELKVTKVSKEIPEKVELDFFIQQANFSMRMIGRKIPFKKVWGGGATHF